jgi:stage V sporulation protein SpoVS
MTAKQRYDRLSSRRSQFLNSARQAADLTLPYLIREDELTSKTNLRLPQPWQSTGAKGVVTLASKLMLALLPPQTSFFKLQVNDINLPQELGPQIRSELDLSFAKVERTIMESIAESGDRVVVHQALKHLVVAGNALVFMSKEGLKLYPLNRYVVDRDGNGNVIEIVTKETVSKKLVKNFYPDLMKPGVVDDTTMPDDECIIYTHVTRDNNRWVWHQEMFDEVLPKSQGKAPIDANPWLVLRFNHVDGEVYGRGRVEEFLGDLKSLEALSQAIVEGSAAAAKVVFTVAPSSTTKPQTLAKAGNGAIIQGRPDDIGVVQVGKTADFSTAYQMIGSLTQRLNEAFLILNVRDSERTTAEEVRMTQLELEQQLGGLFSLLTVEFLIPYLNRKLNVAQKTGEIPRLPKGDIVRPTIVAGINALGRGQDRESLGQFLTIIAQTMGPEAIGQFINPDEVIKRLAAASGIDVLNLVKSMQELQAEQQQQIALQQEMMQMQQAPQMAAVEQKAQQAEMQAVQQQQAPTPPPQ